MATAKLFLDTRYASKDAVEKPATVKIAINHRGKSAAIVTDVKVLPSQWDKVTCKVIGHAQRKMFNLALLSRYNAVMTIMAELTVGGTLSTLSASDLCKIIKERIEPKKEPKPKKEEAPKENPNTVGKFFVRYQENKDIRESSKVKYAVCWRRIEAWLGEEAAAKLEFKDITLGWIEAFDTFLMDSAPKANGRRLHHSALKAVINYAIDYEVTDKNPYRRYKIKTNKTAKRNMSVDALRKIIFARNLEPWMEKYRDFFVLSFMLRGLNTVDLCALPKPIKGRVDWERTKTGQPLSLKIENEMQVLIDRYAGKELMLEFAEGRNYRNFNNKLNSALHKICEHINKDIKNKEDKLPDFTMYWARHTWATIAAKLDIADGTIAIGLAHSQKSVTDIYIERDPEKIDIANRRVLDFVLYCKDYRVHEVPSQPEKKKRGRPKKVATPQKDKDAAA